MIILILFLLGICVGSFVNAFVWRLHEQERSKKKPRKELSILQGRSMCVHCRHQLGAKDLVPVLSWLELRGKCRYCHKPISWQYPLVEVSTAALFVFSYLWWPYGLETAGMIQFGFWLITAAIFMILAVYDLKWMLLPNKIVYPLIALSLAGVILQSVLLRDFSVVWQAFWGVVCLFGLFWFLFQLSNGKWIGGGDVKLAAALGLIVGGPIQAVLVIFLASLLGMFVSVPLMVRGKKSMTSKVPFGPFLLAATVIVVLFGDRMIDWYTKTLLGM